MKVKLIRDRLTPTGPGVSIETVQGPLHVALLAAKLHGIAWHEVMAAAAQKEMERGGFTSGRVLVHLGCKPSNR